MKHGLWLLLLCCVPFAFAHSEGFYPRGLFEINGYLGDIGKFSRPPCAR